MNNKNLFRISLAVILTFTAISGCKKEPVGSVSGTITIYDPASPLVKIPVDSMFVYLIEVPSKPDTMHKDVRTLAMDSVLTGADGSYSFTAIPAGNYAVYPYPGRHSYQFAPDNSGNTFTFSITDDVQVCEINFSSAIPGSDNSSDPYEIKVQSLNRQGGQYFDVYRVSQCSFLGIWEWEDIDYYSDHCSGLDTDLITITASHESGFLGKWNSNDFYLYASDVNNNLANYGYIAMYRVWQIDGSQPTSTWYVNWETQSCYRYH
jgi:hypothetical protein